MNKTFISILLCCLLYSTSAFSEENPKTDEENGNAVVKYLFVLNSGMGFEKISELFIEAGVDVNAQSIGNTPLAFAAERNNLEITKLLIENGADVNKKNDLGSAPLHYATRYNNLEMVKLLVKNGADVNQISSLDDNVPLEYAIYNDNSEMAKFLVEAGADVNSAEEGLYTTPLNEAVKSGNLETVQFLIENGADIYATNYQDRTALDIAIQNDHYNIAQFLRQKGLKIEDRFKKYKIESAIVSLHKENDFFSKSFCSGAYIGNYQIVTAFHCIDDMADKEIYVRFPKGQKEHEGQMIKTQVIIANDDERIDGGKMSFAEYLEKKGISADDYVPSDWIILQLESMPKDVKPFKLGRFEDIPLDRVSIAGYPDHFYNKHLTYIGFMRQDNCLITSKTEKSILAECKKELAPGASGGPIFYEKNDNLHLIGIISLGSLHEIKYTISPIQNFKHKAIFSWKDLSI